MVKDISRESFVASGLQGSPLVAEYSLLEVRKGLDRLEKNVTQDDQIEILKTYSQKITDEINKTSGIKEKDPVPDKVAFLYEKIIDTFDFKCELL